MRNCVTANNKHITCCIFYQLIKIKYNFSVGFGFIINKKATQFYIGNNGNFDAIVLRTLEDLKRDWEDISPEKDPKLQTLKQKLSEQLKLDPDRKIILFSEFADTVDYIFENTKNIPDLKIINYKSNLYGYNVMLHRQHAAVLCDDILQKKTVYLTIYYTG